MSTNLLRTVYFALFDSCLHYGCQVWGQNKNVETNKIAFLQDKAIRIMSFRSHDTPCEPLFNERNIIRFFDLTSFYNCLFIAEHLNQNLPSSFGGFFAYMADCHNYNTRGAQKKTIRCSSEQNCFLWNPFYYSQIC